MYSTLAGRFLTRDSWQGDYNRPLSLNRWNYTEGNPVNYTDPSGYSKIVFKLMGKFEASTNTPPQQEEAYEDISNASQHIPNPTNNGLDRISAILGICNNLLRAFAPVQKPNYNVYIYLRFKESTDGSLDDFMVYINNKSNAKIYLGQVQYETTSVCMLNYCPPYEPSIAWVLLLNQYLMTTDPHKITSVELRNQLTSPGGPPFKWCKKVKVIAKVYGPFLGGNVVPVYPSVNIEPRFYGAFQE